MKTVFSHSELAHQFAHQLTTNGRTSNNSMFIEGDTIYSYGKHFAIAKHGVSERGIPALLFTTRKYSNTTIKHIRHVENACNHLLIIYCNDPSESPRLNFEAMLSEMKGHLKGLDKAKKPEKYIEPAKEVLNRAIIYAKYMGVSVPNELIDLITDVEIGKYKEYLAKESARIEAEKLARELEQAKEDKKRLIKWRKFKGDSRLYMRINDRDYLRFNGKRIETSQGIEMPIEAAKRAYNWILKTIKLGGCNGECAYKILDFSVSAVTPELITIGCHKIELKEINKIAKQLKW